MVEERVLKLKTYLDANGESEKILHALRKLDKLDISVDHLQTTSIGKVVNTFRKCDGVLGEKARSLVAKWKQLVSDSLASKPNAQGGQKEKSTHQSQEVVKEKKKSSNLGVSYGDSKHGSGIHKSEYMSKNSIGDEKVDSIHKDTDSKGFVQSDSDGWREERSRSKVKHHKHSRSDIELNAGKPSRAKSKMREKYDLSPSGVEKRSLDMSENFSRSPPRDGLSPVSTCKPLLVSEASVDDSAETENSGASFGDMLNYDAVVLSKKRKVQKLACNIVKESKSASKSLSGSNLFDSFSETASSRNSHSSEKNGDHQRFSHKTNCHRSGASSKHKDHETQPHKSHKHSSISGSKDKGHEKSSQKSHSQRSIADSKNRDDEKSAHKSHNSNSSRKREDGHSKSAKNKHADGRKNDRQRDRHSDKYNDKRKRSAASFEVPLPPVKQAKMTHTDILQTLPEIQPHYKPLRMPVVESPRKKPGVDSGDLDSLIGAKKYSRTQVYSGKRSAGLTEVPRLDEACMKVLIDNIDALEYVGGVPATILFPVLEKCSPSQLFTLEDFNPHFVEDTEDLWKVHCQRDFKLSKPEEFETHRELYLRLHDEREAKLKALTANINASMAKKTPVRQTKLAYVNTVAKPPREVIRRQMKYGTAGPTSPLKPGVKAPRPVATVTSHGSPAGSSLIRQRQQQKEVKKIAPMMQKTLKFMKKIRR